MITIDVENNEFLTGFVSSFNVAGLEGCIEYMAKNASKCKLDKYREALHYIREDLLREMQEYSDRDSFAEMTKILFSELCDNDYDEAILFLHDHFQRNMYTYPVKSDLKFYIEKCIETKRTPYNVKRISEVENQVTLMDEFTGDSSIGKVYYQFIRKYLPFKESFNSLNRTKELSLLPFEYLESTFGPYNTYADKLQNYFRILKDKDINILINGVEKILDITACEERLFVLEKAFGVLDRDITPKERGKLREQIRPNTLLSKLSRGELQKFITQSDLCVDTKLLLLDSSSIDLIALSDEYETLRENKDMYKEFLSYNFFLDCPKEFKFYRDDLNNEYELSDEEETEYLLRLEEYELQNLIKILGTKSLPQRFKWLNECYPSKQAEEAYTSYSFRREDFDDIPTYYYDKFIQQTIKEFYDTLGIDYDKVILNEEIPRMINFGIEIEEVGISGKTKYTNNYFNSTYDSSLERIVKGEGKCSSGNHWDAEAGEYVSDILTSDDTYDLESIMEEIDILNFFGARENASCGFHVHLSSPYTEFAEYKNLVSIFGMPSEYNSDDYDDSEDKGIYEELKDEEGFLVPRHIAKEIFQMQNVLLRKFRVYRDRITSASYCKKLHSSEPIFDDKFNIFNFASLENGKGFELRFLNLPDYIDKKVVEAYVDFAVTYFAYMEEGNNTYDYAKEAYEEYTGEFFDTQDKTVKEDFMFDILLSQLELKDDTRVVLENLDDIFEFYNTKLDAVSLKADYLVEADETNYYKKYDKRICDECDNEEFSDEVDEEIESNEIVELV